MNDSEYKLAVIRDIDSSSIYHRQPNKNIPIVTFFICNFQNYLNLALSLEKYLNFLNEVRKRWRSFNKRNRLVLLD